ncbi:MAG: ABC transporter ATP-binding protein [Mesorhizobium sp.]|uniref:ABC transporter ATP-binding protein n=1 Tax=Mesorhizobium sp. TaxID=1871066 RepID=UPI000FEA7D3B|nr:ABC transporter ATP-binding protein [Mesorhizobium sp.]RWI57107.1 MAG: ABC transporter ATP-binding protein [Mesorhizobium sp.]
MIGSDLEVLDVTLRFGGIVAVNAISFKVKPGELLALVGPNGAGKTAMLNCINGVYRPRQGSILLDGTDICGSSLHRMMKIGIGRAFQHAELFPHLSVSENLLIGSHCQFRSGVVGAGLYLGKSRCEESAQRRRAEEVIDFFELYRYRNNLVGNLSYGVQKMVGVARALMSEPKLLLLDEPCTGLIREEREDLARFLLRIKHDLGPTMIWVEHDMQMVSDLADRIIVMNSGAKMAEGEPDAVRRDPDVVRAYIGHGLH